MKDEEIIGLVNFSLILAVSGRELEENMLFSETSFPLF